MTIMHNVGFFFIIILMVSLIPTVHAYDNREWQYINEGLSALKAIDANATKALESFDMAIAINPNSHTAWNYRGNALLSLDRYTEAVASFDQAIAINPNYAAPWYNRGSAFMELGRYGEAAASFDKAISLDPNDEMAKSSRENALQKLSQAQPTQAIPSNPAETLSPQSQQQIPQQTKTTPLSFAPVGAIVLIAAIAMMRRHP